jgi:hypothetical protein
MGRKSDTKDASQTLVNLKAQLDQIIPELSAFAFQTGAPPASTGPSARAGSS